MPEVRESLRTFIAAAALRLDVARLRRDIPLAPYTTFRIGGPADVLYDATSADDLANAINLSREVGVPHFVLGLGANILVGDRGVRGVVIRNLARTFWFEEARLRAESGAVMQDLILAAVRRGLSGLEHYIGIPSTVGGAVWQNLHFLAPAPERERTMFIAEVVESCELLAEDGTRRLVDSQAMAFGYDTSILHQGRDTALAVKFLLAPGSQDRMQRILQENLAWRGGRHPWLEIHPSVGSIFKKIEGVGAGRLVDECGLKGHRIGDAQVSYLHANIIVNLGSATASDVRRLISHVQEAVRVKLGHQLDPEIGFVGEF
ncbi:MAG TPA: UDP-N-acetylmuramate dehydrogenase [Gemmatimonadaceae bacterium]